MFVCLLEREFAKYAISKQLLPLSKIRTYISNERETVTLPEMLTEALAFCNRNMKVRTIIDPNTGERADRTKYPIEERLGEIRHFF